MLFLKKDKKLNLDDSYPKSQFKRINFICSLPEANGHILKELANQATNGNRSLLLKLIVYKFFNDNNIQFQKEI